MKYFCFLFSGAAGTEIFKLPHITSYKSEIFMFIDMEYPYPFIPQLMPLWFGLVFITGTCIGSFLNVCIWRIPRGKSIVTPPSGCPKCGHMLPWYENIPLLSWLALRGKCSGCGNPISSRYFFVELLTGMLFFILWWKIVQDRQPLSLALVYFPLTALIITTVFIDIEHFIIPDLTTFPLMLVGVITAALFPYNWHIFGYPLQAAGITAHIYGAVYSLLSMAAGYLIMAALLKLGKFIFKRDALGWGDVKYIAAVAACIGLRGAFFTLLLGSLFGAAFGLVMIIKKKARGTTALPFGPFLAGATYIWIFYGERLMVLYQHLKP
jgi:leader peptidase (prepilin peptidase)/N-methyltransferase